MRYMTEYNSRVILSPGTITTEKKQERRKILEAVFERRKLNYQRYIRKLQDNLDKSEIDTIFD